MDDLERLVQRGEGLWTVMRPMSLLGVPLGRRMAVLRDGEGNVMLQSPFVAPGELGKELERLGKVTDIVVPTCFHDTFVGEVTERYPEANYFFCEGMEKLGAGVSRSRGLSELEATPWARELEMRRLEGMPKLNEHVFLHKRSKWLLASDLVFCYRTNRSGWAAWMAGALGIREEPGMSRMFRYMIKDKAAFRKSLEGLLSWDFDGIVTSHFDVVPSGGKRVLREMATAT